MRKGLLAICLVFGTVLGYAQSLEVKNYDAVVEMNADMIKDVFGHIEVSNKTSADLDVKCFREIYDGSLCAFDSSYFCWDFCYTSDVDSSFGVITIPAGATATDFSGHVFSSGNGSACMDSVKYTFYVSGNPADKVSKTIVYKSVVGFDIEEETLAGSTFYPNPVTNVLNIEVDPTLANGGTTIQIHSILGNKVMHVSVENALTTVNVTSLNSGVYFYSLLSQGDIVETKKFVVRK